MNTLQDLVGAQGKASAFYLKLDDPNNADAVVKEIKSTPGMENYNVHSMRDYLSLMTPSNYPGLSSFIDVVIAISVIIGFIVIFQAMYTAVMERTREIGILKSIGASKFYIVNVILRETVLLAIAGIVAGILFSLVAPKYKSFVHLWLTYKINSASLRSSSLSCGGGSFMGAPS